MSEDLLQSLPGLIGAPSRIAGNYYQSQGFSWPFYLLYPMNILHYKKFLNEYMELHHMNRTVLYLMVAMIAAALVIAPSAAAIFSPSKVSTFQIPSQKSPLGAMNPGTSSSFSVFFTPSMVADYGPPPTPNLILPSSIGTSVSYQNLFIPGACPGGCCGCCC
jgi:hypothetical protein